MHRNYWAGVATVFLLFSTAVSPSWSRCLEGTIVSHYQLDGPMRGLYLYTIELSFSLEKGLSNVTLDPGFGLCPQLACQQIFRFINPAGEGLGQPGDCVVPFIGEFNCAGNPSIDLDDPVVKWDASATEGCEPGTIGSVTLRFYTNLAPDPNRTVSTFLIKNGQEVCEGVVTGDAPSPPCLVPVEGLRWGAIKAIYE